MRLTLRRLGWSIVSALVLAACSSDSVDPASLAPEASSPASIRAEDGDLAVPHLATGELDLRLPNVTAAKPRALDASELARVEEARRELGLLADESYVRDLHAHPEAYGAKTSDRPDLLGLTMTDDEIALQTIRHRLEARAGKLGTSLESSMPATYAGVMLQASEATGEGTVLRVLTTDDSPSTRESILRQVPATLQSRVRFIRVARSLATLRAQADRVEAAVHRIATAAGKGPYLINGSDIELEGNRVTVHVAKLDDATRALLSSEPAFDGVAIVEDGGPAEPTASKDDPLAYGLVEGGQRIWAEGTTASCTSGFAVLGTYGPFILTAGHCNINLPFDQGGGLVGTNAAEAFGGNRDALAISTGGHRAQWGREYRTSGDWGHAVHWAIQTDGDAVGMWVCQDGWHTTGMYGQQFGQAGWSCGPVKSQYFSPSYVPGGTRFRLAAMVAQPGDSGGSVTWDSAWGTAGIGITSGTTPGYLIYGHLAYVLTGWGLVMDGN